MNKYTLKVIINVFSFQYSQIQYTLNYCIFLVEINVIKRFFYFEGQNTRNKITLTNLKLYKIMKNIIHNFL